jgi:Ca2+-binding RTX toxin-like protein
VISGITVQGGELLVQFSEPIDSSGVPTSRFAAMVGATARTITAIQAGADASQLRLSLSGTAPSSSQSVRLSYSDPAGDQSSGVVQDGAGNDLASIARPGRAADTFNSARDVLSLASTTSNLNLLGSANIKGTGNGKANRINGNSGNNLLNGLGGNDVITGGLGGDTFRFATALSGSGNRDQITDFTPGQGDRIELENGIFTALPSTGPLAAAAFTIGSGATTAAHRIIYNAGTGSLSYDSNGSAAGGATVFAMLDPNLLLSHSMFTVT